MAGNPIWDHPEKRDNSKAQWPPASFGSRTEQLATLAGGCFWSVQLAFERVPGVVATCVGYAQGSVDDPSYEQVKAGTTGHVEAVQLTYRPEEVSFDDLVTVFLNKIDPLRMDGQDEDVGVQYRSGIYYHTDEQKEVALARLAAIPGCAVEAEPFRCFWPAEAWHQAFLEKGGKWGNAQSAAKRCSDPIRCNG